MAKAQEAVEAAEQEESKREQKRREAEERRKAAAAEAERAREQAGEAAEQARATASARTPPCPAQRHVAGRRQRIRSEAAAAAAARARRAEPSRGRASRRAVEGPEKPELHVAAAFAGAFLFARILKTIAELMADQQRASSLAPSRTSPRRPQLLVREEIALAKAEMTREGHQARQGRGLRDRRRRLRRLRADLPAARAVVGPLGADRRRRRTTGSASSSPAC